MNKENTQLSAVWQRRLSPAEPSPLVLQLGPLVAVIDAERKKAHPAHGRFGGIKPIAP